MRSLANIEKDLDEFNYDLKCLIANVNIKLVENIPTLQYIKELPDGFEKESLICRLNIIGDRVQHLHAYISDQLTIAEKYVEAQKKRARFLNK